MQLIARSGSATLDFPKQAYIRLETPKKPLLSVEKRECMDISPSKISRTELPRLCMQMTRCKNNVDANVRFSRQIELFIVFVLSPPPHVGHFVLGRTF
jgi:hypothetical protein